MVQALYGLGGVGKTQLAIEYAHRFAADYDLVWWVNAEQPALLGDQLAQLADKLGLPTRASVAGTIELVLGELRRRRLAAGLRQRRTPPAPPPTSPAAPSVLVTSRASGWGRSAAGWRSTC